MLAKVADRDPRPATAGTYEPKWDGFRCIVFRDGDDIELASRNERPFTRYFPELLEPLLAVAAASDASSTARSSCPATDDRGLDFDALLQRIHPAESRVRRLAAETPASFVAFDLLALDDESLLDATAGASGIALLADALADAAPPVYLCPSTTRRRRRRSGGSPSSKAPVSTASIAKRLGDPYTPDKRTLVKVKHQRTADCVIAGYRIHKDGKGVGSLLLGLYDDEGELHHVGVVGVVHREAPRRAARRAGAADPRRARRTTRGGTGRSGWRAPSERQRMPGGGSRWNAGKDLSWVPLRIERVAEVTFGQLQEGRFRHGSHVRALAPRPRARVVHATTSSRSPARWRSPIGRRRLRLSLRRRGRRNGVAAVRTSVEPSVTSTVLEPIGVSPKRTVTVHDAGRAEREALVDRQHGDASCRRAAR